MLLVRIGIRQLSDITPGDKVVFVDRGFGNIYTAAVKRCVSSTLASVLGSGLLLRSPVSVGPSPGHQLQSALISEDTRMEELREVANLAGLAQCILKDCKVAGVLS